MFIIKTLFYTVINLINNLISLSFCSQLFKRNGYTFVSIRYSTIFFKSGPYWIPPIRAISFLSIVQCSLSIYTFRQYKYTIFNNEVHQYSWYCSVSNQTSCTLVFILFIYVIYVTNHQNHCKCKMQMSVILCSHGLLDWFNKTIL
jgi:branched-subunit amino acid transport protein AzlD